MNSVALTEPIEYTINLKTENTKEEEMTNFDEKRFTCVFWNFEANSKSFVIF